MAVRLILLDIEELQMHKEELVEIMNYSLLINHSESRTGNGVYEKLVHYFKLGQTNVWLALDDARAVGFAQFFKKNNERVHLNEIAVAEDYQNKGIGSMLIEAVEDSARECGAAVVELICNEVNCSAKKFYGKHQYLEEKHLMVKAVK